MLIVIIIVAVIIVGFFVFKHFDRDFIKVHHFAEKQYYVCFENGKKPRCELIDVIKYEEKEYYVFIPLESLNNVPVEDVIILELYKKKTDENIFVFPDKSADEAVMSTVINRYTNKKYGNKCHFNFL